MDTSPISRVVSLQHFLVRLQVVKLEAAAASPVPAAAQAAPLQAPATSAPVQANGAAAPVAAAVPVSAPAAPLLAPQADGAFMYASKVQGLLCLKGKRQSATLLHSLLRVGLLS